MKCLILAAGRGTRISRYLSGAPKCTVDVGGEKLIAYTVRLLHQKGVREIALSVGYRAQDVRQALADLPVQYYFNPFFDVTNSIASAWFARDFLRGGDDVMLMNGDVYLDESLLDEMLKSTQSPVMFADESRREEADYKFFYQNGLLEKFGKELSGPDITGEYIGAARMNAEHAAWFVDRMEEMIAQSRHSVWWENVLYENLNRLPVRVENTGGRFWA
ncbi:MAG: phosphocholine cytidylyltransferase family protein, partial [Clostridia bacterium]|nr:phosphocholine cytidylyltransferase family protein [Clostridia bacterium]